jgi:hypothetical protein
MKPHKHANLIKEWADGAKIEARYLSAGGWTEWQLQEGGFIWYHTNAEYRIKPEPKEDIVEYMRIMRVQRDSRIAPEVTYYSNKPKFNYICNLVLIFDGETGELKSAEVIK